MIKKKGFTLIELLVVIAIIGILASIVLVSLSGARTKAKDAAIQTDMAQIRTVAELVYNDGSPLQYDLLCADPQYTTLKDDINKQKAQTVACFASGDDYCVSAVTNGGAILCVSPAGVVGDNACTAANTVCD